MSRPLLLAAALLFAICSDARAEDPSKEIDALRAQGYAVRAITPVFSQLVMLSVPKGFKPAFEKTVGDSYIQESVPEGQTAEEWSQMITLTGAKGLVANAKASPLGLFEVIAATFKRGCPETFSAVGLGTLVISGYDAYAGVAACGSVEFHGSKQSQAALIIAIKGSDDYYTVRWADRTGPSDQEIGRASCRERV